MSHESRHLATEQYLRRRRIRRWLAFTIVMLVAASVAMTYAGAFGRCGDDWARFDHQTFTVIGIESGDSIRIWAGKGTIETVELLGVASPAAGAKQWLIDRAMGRKVTLLLQVPQTRNASGSLLAFVFVEHSNLSVELAAAGLIFADRRKKSVLDGVIDPAESAARKKKMGMWAELKFDQMPQWRKDWLRSFSR